jgi:hypothetical protein
VFYHLVQSELREVQFGIFGMIQNGQVEFQKWMVIRWKFITMSCYIVVWQIENASLGNEK